MKKSVLILSALTAAYLTGAIADTKNKSDQSLFGPNVIIFDPSMPSEQINQTIQAIYDKQRFNQFGEERYAFLFKPGNYGEKTNVDVKVGYYTQVLGLGETPDAVVITGAVRTQDAIPKDDPGNGPGALNNFWRGAENLAVIPTLGSVEYKGIPLDQNVWAVSQASPLRRIHIINGSLRLFDVGWSSGGYLANTKVDHAIISGSQQQWFSRNTRWENWLDGNWNMVGVGTSERVPQHDFRTLPYLLYDKTPIISDKPFLFLTKENQYAVMVPQLEHATKFENWSPGVVIPISDFYIAKPNYATSDTINAALEQNKNILFTPGIYHLKESIQVKRANTVILGIGMPTLTPDNGQSAIIVADVDGVKIAGLTIDAGPISSATLIKIGESKSALSHAANPTVLSDLFCRIGAAFYTETAESCVTINSNNVIGDNFWLWRADHGPSVGWELNPSKNGLIVNGDDVTIYGLAVEHFQQYQTLWNGENGAVYFYQSEMPYDPPSQSAWMNGKTKGYAAYKVADNVKKHHAWGVGVYCFFRDAENIYADRAFEVPTTSDVQFHHLVTVWLDGKDDTGIRHVINDLGNEVTKELRISNLMDGPTK